VTSSPHRMSLTVELHREGVELLEGVVPLDAASSRSVPASRSAAIWSRRWPTASRRPSRTRRSGPSGAPRPRPPARRRRRARRRGGPLVAADTGVRDGPGAHETMTHDGRTARRSIGASAAGLGRAAASASAVQRRDLLAVVLRHRRPLDL